jgi:NH3-dependent NAD+ synthetase
MLNMIAQEKYDSLVNRLVYKIQNSQVEVPGFILGLSGTDSILSFALLYAALDEIYGEREMPIRLWGIHYTSNNSRRQSWFELEVIPWMKEKFPGSQIEVYEPMGGNQDQQRWADLHYRALNAISNDKWIDRPNGTNYWVAGSMNATEQVLGNYSMLSTAVSIQPIQTVYKSMVMAICKDVLDVPEVVLRKARIPDCLCGRDELASNNIELIDKILVNDPEFMDNDPALVKTLCSWIQDLKKSNGFKTRIPYKI